MYRSDYGNAPRRLDPWWPQVNFAGQPTVQPVANPYFAHWSQDLGAMRGAEAPMLSFTVPVAAALVGGAVAAVAKPMKAQGRGANAVYGVGLGFLIGAPVSAYLAFFGSWE